MEARPKKLTPESARKVAIELAGQLAKDGHIPADDVESAADDIAKHGRPHMNGYELAKQLDDYCHWSPNADMVEALDSYSWMVDSEIKAAQQAWAERNNVQPPLPIGTRVQTIHGDTGVLDAVYEHDAAKYCVKMDGDPEASAPTNARRIIAFEDVQPLAAV